MGEGIKCTTYNVNGINDNKKRTEVFHYLHMKKMDVILMQETHSTKQVERYWSSTWGSKIWSDHGESNARG